VRVAELVAVVVTAAVAVVSVATGVRVAVAVSIAIALAVARDVGMSVSGVFVAGASPWRTGQGLCVLREGKAEESEEGRGAAAVVAQACGDGTAPHAA